MKFFVPIICLFCVPTSVLGRGIIFGDEMFYHDLMRMNASCHRSDLCMEVRDNYYPSISDPYTCSCDRQCWQYSTCCMDSPYRKNTPPIYECRGKGMMMSQRSGYFMVQKCSVPIWKSWCEAEPNGESDILKLSPLTSLDTNTTYKNYYCFRCHETTDNFILWNLSLRDVDKSPDNSESGYRVTYNQVITTSVYAKGEKPFSNPFTLSFELPDKIFSLAIACDPGIVSDCDKDWMYKEVLDKCRAYTSIVYSKHNRFVSYKNAHCALCNYESLDDFSCEPLPETGYGGGGGYSNKFNANLPDKEGCKVGQYKTAGGECLENFDTSLIERKNG